MNQETSSINKAEQENSLLDNDVLAMLPMNNPGIVAVLRHRDMKLLFLNNQFEYYLGYSNADLAGDGIHFTDLLESYQFDHLENQLKQVTESIPARSAYVIYQLKGKNGKIAPYYLYASSYTTPGTGGERLYFILMHPDLSKWGMPFTSFDSKELFLEQFKSQNFGTFEWIINVDKVFWSAGIYSIYEIEENVLEINNLFTTAFIHPYDKLRVETETEKAITNGTDLNIEYKIVTAKKNTKTIHCLARTIKNKDGVTVKFAGSVRDVTEQRMIEEDLKNKVNELYHSNRELEDFAYVASHDLQEPLRKITTFSDRLTDKYKDVLTGDGAMYLKRMIAAAENMRILINDLLEFSRISKTGQEFMPVKLDRILGLSKTELELKIEETGTIIYSQDLPEIDAIDSQMNQLFTNIIGNAIKFQKPDQSPVINITSAILSVEEKRKFDLPANIPYYKIEITDNGIGFEDEYATRIFQVFQRLHGKSEYPGSGIGLAICKKIMEHHHGIIYAENVPDVGARFVLIIPQKQQ